MKKILICAALAMAMGAAFSMPISAEVTTTGPEGDTTFGYTGSYVAYLCTEAAAASLFNGNSYFGDVSSWLESNYATGIDNLTGGGDGVWLMDSYGFDAGEYSFTKYVKSGFDAGNNYLAVVTYAAEDGVSWYRVFGNTAEGDGTLTMDAAAHPEIAGEWTQTVPEPTSGLLLLLGVAGLALKRKRA